MTPPDTGAGAARVPLVSVLVPSFNHAHYLEPCLDSVLHDDAVAKELLVLDDGSQDSSVAVANDWAARNGHLLAGGCRVWHRPNRGVAATLNELIAQARGDYLAFLASDDQLLPGGIRARVEFLQRHPELLAVFGDAQLIDLEGRPKHDSAFHAARSNRQALRCDATLGVELISHWVMPGPVFLMRREAIARIGVFDERYRYEDRDYYLRLIAAGALGFLDAAVARYRVPPEKKRERYDALAADRAQIERSLLPRFRGLEWLALRLVVQRHRRTGPKWLRRVRPLLVLLRRYNAWRAGRRRPRDSAGG